MIAIPPITRHHTRSRSEHAYANDGASTSRRQVVGVGIGSRRAASTAAWNWAWIPTGSVELRLVGQPAIDQDLPKRSIGSRRSHSSRSSCGW